MNTDNELDKILERVYLFGMNSGVGYGKFENELSPKEAKQAILKNYRHIDDIEEPQVTPTHIMGKSIDEVCGILAMLDMERLAEMQLTMKNLKLWQKLLAEEQKKIFEKSFSQALNIKEQNNG